VRWRQSPERIKQTDIEGDVVAILLSMLETGAGHACFSTGRFGL
jgi:hypothetical protein